jgi:hypothetical protein
VKDFIAVPVIELETYNFEGNVRQCNQFKKVYLMKQYEPNSSLGMRYKRTKKGDSLFNTLELSPLLNAGSFTLWQSVKMKALNTSSVVKHTVKTE